MPASSMLALFVPTNCVSRRKQTWIVRLVGCVELATTHLLARAWSGPFWCSSRLLERFGQRLELAVPVDARQGRMPFGQQHGVAVELVVVNNLDMRDSCHRGLERQKIIIVRRTLELAADVDDHQIMAGVFDVPVGQPPLPQQLGPSHLEVDKIVGMRQQAHAVGLGITHTNRQLMTVAHALPGLPCRAACPVFYRLIVSGSIIECSLPAGPRSGCRGACVTVTRGNGS